MSKTLFTTVAVLALACSGVAVAQQAPPSEAAMAAAMTTEQRAAYDAWTAEQRSDYDGWPADVGAYYWTLTPAQQKAWWVLKPEQRTQVFGMTPADRTTTWASIEAQLAAPNVVQTQANPPGPGPASPVPPNPETASAPVPPAMPADPGYMAGPYKGALTPPPAAAMSKTYPLCTRDVQDSCVNPGEAGAGQRRAARSIRKRS